MMELRCGKIVGDNVRELESRKADFKISISDAGYRWCRGRLLRYDIINFLTTLDVFIPGWYEGMFKEEDYKLDHTFIVLKSKLFPPNSIVKFDYEVSHGWCEYFCVIELEGNECVMLRFKRELRKFLKEDGLRHLNRILFRVNGWDNHDDDDEYNY